MLYSPYSSEQYHDEFLADPDLNKKALDRAHDIRKFEIDLYWKRATYFWTFIAATFAGFLLVQTSAASYRQDMSVLLANLGIVFSFGWLCVNRASKFWQENWESHVDKLEDKITGRLYKVVISKHFPVGFNERFFHVLTGSSEISVSRINQLISMFVTFMWLYLLYYALPPFSFSAPINWEYLMLIMITVGTCYLFSIKSKDSPFRRAKIRSWTISK